MKLCVAVQDNKFQVFTKSSYGMQCHSICMHWLNSMHLYNFIAATMQLHVQIWIQECTCIVQLQDLSFMHTSAFSQFDRNKLLSSAGTCRHNLDGTMHADCTYVKHAANCNLQQLCMATYNTV